MNKKYTYVVYEISDVECYPVSMSMYDSYREARKTFLKILHSKNNTFDCEIWRFNKNVYDGKRKLVESWSFGDDLPEVEK